MENAPAMPPAPAPMPAPAAPAPLGPALPPPAPAAPAFEKGGDVSGGDEGGGFLSKLTSGVNMIDVVVMSFFVGGTIYFLHVYKTMMQMQKVGYNDLSARVSKIESAEAARKAEAMANASGKMKRKFPVMRLS
jgi:hypothetical protein